MRRGAAHSDSAVAVRDNIVTVSDNVTTAIFTCSKPLTVLHEHVEEGVVGKGGGAGISQLNKQR